MALKLLHQINISFQLIKVQLYGEQLVIFLKKLRKSIKLLEISVRLCYNYKAYESIATIKPRWNIITLALYFKKLNTPA